MKKMKKLLAVLLAGVMTASLAVMSVSAEEGTSGESLSDEILTVAIEAEPNTLVPDVTFLGNHISAILRLIYEPLVIQDVTTMEATDNGLVTKVENVDDTHIAITLREGVKFQSGKEFTTADVQYQFEQGIRGGRSDFYYMWDPENNEIIDDYNMVLALHMPWAQATELLGFDVYLAVDSEVLGAAGGADATVQYLENAGTGKYRMTEWVPGQYIMLERNEDYWDKDNMGYYAGYKFVFITDASARAMSVQSGDADLALNCAVSDYSVYDADPNVQAKILESGNSSVLFLNCGNGGPFEDEKVREAVYWLLDIKALKEVGNSGLGKYVDTTISPLCPMWDGIAQNETKEVDVEKAKALLAEAGYENGVTIKARTSSVTAVLSMIQEQLRAGGIEMEFEVAETQVHFAALAEGDYDCYLSTQQCGYYSEAVRTTDGYTYSFADVYGGCGYNNEEYGKICQKALTTYDVTERKETYAQLQQHFRDHYVSVALYTTVNLEIARKDLENINLYGIGIVDLSNLRSTGE